MAGLSSWLLGRRIGTGIEDLPFWRWWGGNRSRASKRSVTASAALMLSTWMACVRLNAETVGTLPVELYEMKPNGERVPAVNHPLYRLLKYDPNVDQTAPEFWEGHVAGMLVYGNGFAEKIMQGDRLVALDPIPYTSAPHGGVLVRRDLTSGQLLYTFTDRSGRRREDVPDDLMFHTRGFGFGGDLGLSIIEHATQSIAKALDTQEASARMFGSGMRATGLFMPPVNMDERQRAQFRKNFVEPMEGPESEGKSLLVPPGFRWQALNIPPKDAEMILSLEFDVEEMCRWFATPPMLIGHTQKGQTMFGTGVEQIVLGWLTLGLRRTLVRVERSITKRLLSPADRLTYKVEIDVEAILRADSAGRAALMAVLSQNGLRTRNELRVIDNYPRMPGADQLTAQSNLMPLDKLGQAGAAPSEIVRNALLAWLADARQAADKKAA